MYHIHIIFQIIRRFNYFSGDRVINLDVNMKKHLSLWEIVSSRIFKGAERCVCVCVCVCV